ncbi:MAG TPA: hypothetical protein PLR74_12315, partial [Agriterribacter sp.]|nr:hypothetical protein [Agriterribacter sp.]
MVDLQCQYRDFPLGIDDPAPRLSWQLTASRRNVMQKAYRVLVADDTALLRRNTGNVWDSKKVVTDQSVQV